MFNYASVPYFLNEGKRMLLSSNSVSDVNLLSKRNSLLEWNDFGYINDDEYDDDDDDTIITNVSFKKAILNQPQDCTLDLNYLNPSSSSIGCKKKSHKAIRFNKLAKHDNYTLAGRNQQQMRQFSKFCYSGTFLTQYKIRENYKFLQMISVPPLDPAVPKPEGGTSVPACGEPLVVPASFPQSIEAAIHKFANASSKATCISVLDQFGKPANSLTYGN